MSKILANGLREEGKGHHEIEKNIGIQRKLYFGRYKDVVQMDQSKEPFRVIA